MFRYQSSSLLMLHDKSTLPITPAALRTKMRAVSSTGQALGPLALDAVDLGERAEEVPHQVHGVRAVVDQDAAAGHLRVRRSTARPCPRGR